MVIDDNDRRLINVPLIKGEDKYTIDFEGIERAICWGKCYIIPIM